MRGGNLSPRSLSDPFTEDTVVALLDVIAAPLKTPGSQAVRAEAVRAVLTQLESLPEDQRRAIWLMHVEGMSSAVAAAAMGRTEPSLRGLCARGLKKLQAAVRDTTSFKRDAPRGH